MKRPIRQLLSLITVGLLLEAAGSALAQQATTSPPLSPLSYGGLTGSGAETRLVTDIFLGKNVVGPYLLTWRGIEPGSEVVMRDAKRLIRDADYRLDSTAGVLIFTTPLRAQQIARVDYRCVPGKAVANFGAAAAPMQFNLFEGGSGALTFNALYRPEVVGPANTKMATGGRMLLGFGGNAKLAPQSSLTSRLFLDTHGGNLLDRSGVQIGEKTVTRFGQFSAGFTRGGSGFLAEPETGILRGKQIIEAAGSLNPIHGIQASASFRQMTDLPAQGKGTTVTTLGQRLAGTLGAVTRFLATRTQTLTETPDGPTMERVVDRLQIDQPLGTRTQATAVLERSETTTGDGGQVAQTGTLTLRAQPSDRLAVQGSFQNRLLPSGAEDATNLRIEAEPTRQVRLTALLGERYRQSGALHSREATVEYAPGARLTLSGVLQLRAEGNREAFTGGLKAAARPTKYLEVSGGFKQRDATVDGVPDPNAPDTYNVNLALRLFGGGMRLTGGYADNPEDDKGLITRARSHRLGLQSTWGRLDLSGDYSLQDEHLTNRASAILDLRVGWRFAPTTQLITGYHGTRTQESSLFATDTYSLRLMHRAGTLLDVILGTFVTTYSKNGLIQPDSDYRAEAKIGIRF